MERGLVAVDEAKLHSVLPYFGISFVCFVVIVIAHAFTSLSKIAAIH